MADEWGPRYGWRTRLGGLAWRLSEVTSKNESSEQRLARLKQVLDRHVRHFGADSYPATMCRIDMARTLERVNRPEEAAVLRRQTVAAFRNHRGHSETRTLGEGVHLVNDLYLADTMTRRERLLRGCVRTVCNLMEVTTRPSIGWTHFLPERQAAWVLDLLRTSRRPQAGSVGIRQLPRLAPRASPTTRSHLAVLSRPSLRAASGSCRIPGELGQLSVTHTIGP
jgi:hypothetical protein